jgi:hypothetical protein
MYQSIVSSTHRPELKQALCERAGWGGPAAYWKQRAITAYLQSAQRGEVHYYHHLVDYYTDVAKNGGEAVKWAYKDLQLRENFATQAALAWALYRDGRCSEAVDWIDHALASGVVDALLNFRAGRSTAQPATRLKAATCGNGH